MNTITSISPSVFTFRKCLWLCLPALIIGGVLRISFMAAIPEAYYGSDSNSYYSPARDLWLKGKIDFPTKRRWIYPILLFPARVVPACNTVQVVAFAQHLLGLATIVGIGWIVGNLTRFPAAWVPIVTTMAAVWPRMLWYEHEIMGECLLLATFVGAAAVAFPLQRLANKQRLFWFLIWLCAIIATKPHGRPLWFGLLVVGAFFAGNPLRWGRKNWIALGASLIVLLSAGSGSQGSWLLLSSTLPLVKTEGAKWQEYRDILKPVILQVRQDLPNYATNQSQYKKRLSNSDMNGPLGPVWATLSRDSEKYSRVAKRLAVEGILSNPGAYIVLSLRKVFLAASDTNAGAVISVSEFWEKQESINTERWERKPEEMKLIYEMDQTGYKAMVAERTGRKLWIEPVIRWLAPRVAWTNYNEGAVGVAPIIRPTWLGWLLIVGMIASISRFRETAIITIPTALYMMAVFGVGDAVRRYLQPVDWVGLVVIAVGLDQIVSLVVRCVCRQKPDSVMGQESAPAT